MAEKKEGYSFWRETLGSPKYVAAPMVDMSELAFRHLCRHHETQICYTPMLHSQQFIQDSLYRSDTFTTCAEDRPLIAQFCANDPSTFVRAAHMVANQCDAVDLNLGCPQSIAKKGHYGAFLQDEWEIVSSLIKKASNELPVPVTCKMRILPGETLRSVEYAKMLEHSGCSVLAVHGRTRDQKGHNTGLASWDVIRDIKESVNIPVIANGNILSFEDVQDCLNYTRADAVMSAEGLLHNPALFSCKNPPVWEIVEEYLNLAKIHQTQFRHVRNHLFRILYLCVRQDAKLMQDLMDGSNLEDFNRLCNSLRLLPQTRTINAPSFTETDKEDFSIFDDAHVNKDQIVMLKSALSPLEESFFCHSSKDDENLSKNFHSETSCQKGSLVGTSIHKCYHMGKNEHCHSKNSSYNCKDIKYCQAVDNPADEMNGGVGMLSESAFNGACHPWTTDDQLFSAITQKPIKCLPVWLCHSRPRMLYDNEGKGFSHKNEEAEESIKNESEEHGLSKKKLRKERHHARVVAAMKDKRKTKKLRKKQKSAERRENSTYVALVRDPSVKIKTKETKEIIRQRMIAAKGVAPKVCIDLGFTKHMTDRELSKLSSQLRRLYGSNRQSPKPLHLFLCNLNKESSLYKVCCAKNDGFASYVVDMIEDSPEDVFPGEALIYLSPDSENVLDILDTQKMYIIGGIYDETVYKGMSLAHAQDLKVKTARLPIIEHLERKVKSKSGTVLTVNQVFDVLLKYHETSDWFEALSTGVPQRRGFKLSSVNKITSPTTTESTALS